MPRAEHNCTPVLVSAGLPGAPEGRVPLPLPSPCRPPFCFPNALSLGTLPQNMQYVWVPRPSPTPLPRAAPGPQGSGYCGPISLPHPNPSSLYPSSH